MELKSALRKSALFAAIAGAASLGWYALPVHIASVPEVARYLPDLDSASMPSPSDLDLAFGPPSGRNAGDRDAFGPAALSEVIDRVSEDTLDRHVLRVDPDDTLMAMLVGAGVERREAHGAIAALSGLFDPRRLRIGQELTLEFGPGPDGAKRLHSVSLPPSTDYSVRAVRRHDGGFAARRVDRPLVRKPIRAKGEIRTTLFEAGLDAAIPAPVLIELIRALSFDVDFQREVQRGDRFDVMYELVHDRRTAEIVRAGDILRADFARGGTTLRIYRYTTANGVTDYFNEKGESVRKALMRTPVDGARLSSGYGMRRHPILGYGRMHRGVDFAAPNGTPIMAAGDGVVAMAQRNGGYGRYIRIRHNSVYSTAYAHLSRYANGVKRGRRVRQGQIIGYVGSTGRSTGPHLHYEVLRQGRQMNPANLKLPSGEKLKGVELARFQRERARLDIRFAALAPTVSVAQRGN